MKKLILVLLVVCLLFLVSCEEEPVLVEENQIISEAIEVAEVEPEPIPEPEPIVIEPISCTTKTDCVGNEACIEGFCGLVSDLYNTNCENKCSYDSLIIVDQTGERFEVLRGQGSYTAAGAVEWKTLVTPEYCKQNNLPIPIKVIKKNTGKVLSEEVLVLNVGKLSSVVKHPSIASIAVTFKVESINEVCS
jgi:hypothetical protein